MLTPPRVPPVIVTFVMFPIEMSYRLTPGGVTFVIFAVTRPIRLEAQDSIPGRGKFATQWPRAKAVGAFAAHPDGCRRTRHVAGAGENAEEDDLLVHRPAVMARPGDGSRGRVWAVHRPAWSRYSPCRTGESEAPRMPAFDPLRT